MLTFYSQIAVSPLLSCAIPSSTPIGYGPFAGYEYVGMDIFLYEEVQVSAGNALVCLVWMVLRNSHTRFWPARV